MEFEYFSKICRENTGFYKNLKGKGVLYMEAFVRLYLSELFLE
jgi:hypothetical protein